jgi:hypothetical protein
LGGDHGVISVSLDVKKRFDEYCFKLGVKEQHITDKVLLELMAQGISDDELELAGILKEAVMRITFAKNFKQLLNDMHVFGIYANGNMDKQIKKMPNLDEDTKDLIARAYDLGKDDSEDVKNIMKRAVELRERIKKSKQKGVNDADTTEFTEEESKHLFGVRMPKVRSNVVFLKEPAKNAPTLEEIAFRKVKFGKVPKLPHVSKRPKGE